MPLKSWGLGVCLLGALSGCYDIRANIDDYHSGVVREMHASRAWRRCKCIYSDVDHKKHFGDGFIAGYEDVAAGGSGCAPTLPPEKYWSVWYQNPKGQSKVRAWFEGFAHGALAAEQEGAAHWGTIMTNRLGQGCLVPEGAEHEIILQSPEGYGVDPGPLLPPGVPPAPAAEPIDMTLDPLSEALYTPASEPLPESGAWEMPVQSTGVEQAAPLPELPPEL